MSADNPTGGERLGAIQDAARLDTRFSHFNDDVMPLWHQIPTVMFSDTLKTWTAKVKETARTLAEGHLRTCEKCSSKNHLACSELRSIRRVWHGVVDERPCFCSDCRVET